jgi:hypothetical protein
MKIILLTVVILFLSLVQNISAEKTITCKKLTYGPSSCSFADMTVRQNEAVSIKIEPPSLDGVKMTYVRILRSSIYSLPRGIFTKFPNLKSFHAPGQNIQQLKPDTFTDEIKLEVINLENNELTFLHQDTFNGKLLLKWSMF